MVEWKEIMKPASRTLFIFGVFAAPLVCAGMAGASWHDPWRFYTFVFLGCYCQLLGHGALQRRHDLEISVLKSKIPEFAMELAQKVFDGYRHATGVEVEVKMTKVSEEELTKVEIDKKWTN